MAQKADSAAPFLVVDDLDTKKNLSSIYTAICTDAKKGNLTCSGDAQFCFLCNYCDTTECEVDLRAHIADLAETGAELFNIARAAHTIYNQSIRPTLVHTDDKGARHKSPEWSLASIKRHLLLSGEYDAIFSNYERFVMSKVHFGYILDQPHLRGNKMGRERGFGRRLPIANLLPYFRRVNDSATSRRTFGQRGVG